MTGGSAIFSPAEVGPLTATMQGWCPGMPGGLELVYRASRDGWGGASFYAKCGKGVSSTTYLVPSRRREDCSRRRGVFRRRLGGFFCTSAQAGFRRSACHLRTIFQRLPVHVRMVLPLFSLPSGASPLDTATKGARSGPHFGNDLYVERDGNSGGLLCTGNYSYDVPSGSDFLHLHRENVSEVEAFRVWPQASAVPHNNVEFSIPQMTNRPTPPVLSNDDVRSFGTLIAGSLIEEGMALHQAEVELSVAKARTNACAAVFAAVYGPDFAAGKVDPVVELSVRGTRMTTLPSTLQACPDSALAVRFDDEKWPAAEKDLDEHGRRKIDCSSSVFSKVLDVLRMRKRSAWTSAVRSNRR